MERVRIADQIIDLEVSDQDFFKKRLQEYAIVDTDQKSDMNLTTCILEEIPAPEGTVIKKCGMRKCFVCKTVLFAVYYMIRNEAGYFMPFILINSIHL